MQTTVSRWIPWVKAGAASGSRPKYSTREAMTAVVFVAPSLLLFSIWIFYPLVRSVYLSFHGNDLFGNPAAFVGLAQYQELFTLPGLRETILRTAMFTVLTVVPGLVLGTLIALSLQARIAGIGIFRTLFATPFAFSVATASVIFQIFFNPGVGVFNGILNVFHVQPVGWLTNPATALASVAVATVWLQLGYNVLVLSAGLQAIPEEVYEAAKLDGARGMSLARFVTLPLLTPYIFFNGIMGLIVTLQIFTQSFIMTQGGPIDSTAQASPSQVAAMILVRLW